MPAIVRVVGMRTPVARGVVIDTTSRAREPWQRGLSPFHLGPSKLYSGFESATMENAWQFTKVYPCHANARGEPTDAYWSWAESGWRNRRAVRYPMGRGARPLYSLWWGERLDYISARKRIYVPLYARAVRASAAWPRLQSLYEGSDLLVLRDFDGYDHRELGMTLRDVLHDASARMGHAFVLAMLLERDPALEGLPIW